MGWAGLQHDPYHGSCCHDHAGLPAPAAHLQWMASHRPTAHLGQWCLSGDAESKVQNGKEKEQIANGACVGVWGVVRIAKRKALQTDTAERAKVRNFDSNRLSRFESKRQKKTMRRGRQDTNGPAKQKTTLAANHHSSFS